MRTIKLVTCPTCYGRRTVKITLIGGGVLRISCGTCTGTGKVVKKP